MRSVFFVVALLAVGSTAWSQTPAWTVSAGYSRIYLGHIGDSLFYTKDGGYVDGDVSWQVARRPVPLLLGVGIGVSGYYSTQDIVNSSSFFFFDQLTSNVDLLTLEARASFPISPPGWRGWFIMPRLGTGLLVDSYSINDQFKTHSHAGAAYEIRPSVQAGYSWRRSSVGAEFSYMAAWGGFGGLGAAAQEFRAGVFFRMRF